jgi:hypothetical protein
MIFLRNEQRLLSEQSIISLMTGISRYKLKSRHTLCLGQYKTTNSDLFRKAVSRRRIELSRSVVATKTLTIYTRAQEKKNVTAMIHHR